VTPLIENVGMVVLRSGQSYSLYMNENVCCLLILNYHECVVFNNIKEFMNCSISQELPSICSPHFVGSAWLKKRSASILQPQRISERQVDIPHPSTIRVLSIHDKL